MKTGVAPPLFGLLAVMLTAFCGTFAAQGTPPGPVAGNNANTTPGMAIPAAPHAATHQHTDMDTMPDMDGMDDMAGMNDMGDMPGMTRHAAPPGPKPGTALVPPRGRHHAHSLPDTLLTRPQGTPRGGQLAPAMLPGGAGRGSKGAGGVHVALPPLTPDARWPATAPPVPHIRYVHDMPPVMDRGTYLHVLMDQLEDRYSAGGSLFRYSGQAWYGSDYNKLWLKSEGSVDRHGTMTDGDHELLYDRAISTYFDVQTGVRLDLDSGPVRAWGAVGVQGLALYFFDVSATAYFNSQGVAGKLEGSYDLLITNRLILQPQAELNFYSRTDTARDTSAGFSDIDAGLRLRYEFTRKVAPYIALTYTGHYGDTASHMPTGRHAPTSGPEDLRFTFGVRTWY
ncbi:copper resistance protein B [Acetobacter sp.]|uniref:copper resistance protein B n=1 Tax=Acetobacter sp. TaxID=440 RepID=UPI0039E94A52